LIELEKTHMIEMTLEVIMLKSLLLYLRNFVLFSVLLFVLGAGCAGSRNSSDEAVLTFSAGGELLPVYNDIFLFEKKESKKTTNSIKPLLLERDISLVNLTGGIDLGCETLAREENYKWSPAWFAPLASSNVRVLNMACDHCLDCGREALSKSINQLLAEGFYVVGAGRNQTEARSPVYLTRNGVTISLVSFSIDAPPGISECDDCSGPSLYDRPSMISALKEMKKRADHRLVIFHFKESEAPGLSDDELGAVREAVDYGADLVLGYGPKSGGGLMRIRGRWAVLGLGRFTGDPSSAEEKVTDGLFLSVEFTPNAMMNVRIVPIELIEGRPRLIRGEQGAEVLEKIRSAASPEVQENTFLLEDILYLK
jgi:Bacterial capsule synthesis protein PGA_cap